MACCALPLAFLASSSTAFAAYSSTGLALGAASILTLGGNEAALRCNKSCCSSSSHAFSTGPWRDRLLPVITSIVLTALVLFALSRATEGLLASNNLSPWALVGIGGCSALVTTVAFWSLRRKNSEV
jgi:hypothetical protein